MSNVVCLAVKNLFGGSYYYQSVAVVKNKDPVSRMNARLDQWIALACGPKFAGRQWIITDGDSNWNLTGEEIASVVNEFKGYVPALVKSSLAELADTLIMLSIRGEKVYFETTQIATYIDLISGRLLPQLPPSSKSLWQPARAEEEDSDSHD